MKAKVLSAFEHSEQRKMYNPGDTFEGDQKEIDRINGILPNSLEVIVEKVEKVKDKK